MSLRDTARAILDNAWQIAEAGQLLTDATFHAPPDPAYTPGVGVGGGAAADTPVKLLALTNNTVQTAALLGAAIQSGIPVGVRQYMAKATDFATVPDDDSTATIGGQTWHVAEAYDVFGVYLLLQLRKAK